MKKRNILTLALAICLIAIMACGSLAYFTNTKTVINTFHTAINEDTNGDGKVDEEDLPPTAENIFSIMLTEPKAAEEAKGDEAKVVANEDDGYDYKMILPGDTLVKDPTVTNTGEYPAFVRMNVTVDYAKEWQDAIAKYYADDAGSIADFDLATIFGEFNTDWVLKEVKTSEDNTLTYVYYLNEELPVDGTSTLFESVTIPAKFGVDEMLTLKEFSLTITADAIQSMNTGDPDDEELDSYYAFQNFWAVNNPESTEPEDPAPVEP